MKKYLLIIVALFGFYYFTIAQGSDYKVVFDLTSKDTTNQKNVLRWVSGIMESNPDAQLEIVLYGQSLDLVLTGKSAFPDMLNAATAKNVSVSVCGMALKRHQIDPAQLISGVRIVPDGVYEIIKRQQEGWGYIKVTQ